MGVRACADQVEALDRTWLLSDVTPRSPGP